MKAYLVHNDDGDLVVIPKTGVVVKVTRQVLDDFFGDCPDFSTWKSWPANMQAKPGCKPGQFGIIAAEREFECKVVIIDDDLMEYINESHGG